MNTLQYCIVIRKYNCYHGKRRRDCKPCGGSGICEHDKHRSSCRDCKGSSICEHDKQRSSCRDCKGLSICEHGKRRSRCKPCGGSSICEHDKRRSRCIECGGSELCEHTKQRNNCKPCGGSNLCKSSWCHTTKNRKYDGYCVLCYTHLFPDMPLSRNYKTKEMTVVDYVKIQFPHYEWIHDKRIVDGCSKRRPDLLLDLGSHIIIIEIDEFKHDSYTTECEIKRLNDISLDVGCRQIVMIRFNPDQYIDINGKTVTTCWAINNTTKTLQVKKSKIDEWKYRLERLRSEILQSITVSYTNIVHIIELFY